jgi:hypothetical protein
LIPASQSNSNRLVIDPIDDALYRACQKYMQLIAGGSVEQKNRQYAIIEELLLDRLDRGDLFELPSEDDLPTDQVMSTDTITEGQSIKIIASVMREIEQRRRRTNA